MKVIPLSEGAFTIDKTKQFVPFNQTHDDLQARPVGSLLVEIQPFVVVTDKDVLLLDTGLGFSIEGIMQIHKNLKTAGIEPAAITKVLISHLHKDHAGGIAAHTNKNQLCFPGATYYVQQSEFDFASGRGSSSYLPEEFRALATATNVEWLNQEQGIIDAYIEYSVTGAHSPHHQVFWIRENNQTIFFGADDAPQFQQMKHKFSAKYDFDGKKAMELRKLWWDEGQAAGWTFLFYHDINTPVFIMEKK